MPLYDEAQEGGEGEYYDNHTAYSLDTPSFRTYYELWFCSGALITYINRFLTLYIMVQRLRCVCNVTTAKKLLARTPRQHWRDTVCFGVVPGGLLYLCRYGIPALLIYIQGMKV